MAYIGKQPIVGNFVKLDTITTSATTTFNLTNGGVAYSPQSANNCIVSLNGVIQAPTSAYTISGSTIVFDSALTAADVIDFILVLGDVLNIGTPSDNTITTAKLATGITTTHGLGSASTPSITFTGDTNTGIFSPTADTIAFTEGGSEAMRITSDRDLLVQKTSIGTGGAAHNSFDALYSFDSATVNIASGATGSVKYFQSGNMSGSALVIINAYNLAQGNENRGVVLFINFRDTNYPGGTVINTISTAFADSGDGGAITNITFAIDAANSELDITPSLRSGSGTIVVNVRFIAM
jgi:hypothetical protein